jgi:hypothetical protein
MKPADRKESGTVSRTPFVLCRGAQRVPLREGETIIGRGADADVVLDGHMVSRRHCKITVTESAVFVEDMGSMNGVRVDGELVRERVLVGPGARITVADAVFQLSAGEEQDGVRATRRMRTQDAPADEDLTTRRTHAFKLMAGMVDKAIALRKPEEAERLLGSLLAEVLDEAQRTGVVPPEVAEAAADSAVRLAGALGKSQWVEYPLRLYVALGKPLPRATVDDLFAVARRTPRMDRALLDRYIAALEGTRLGPSDRFVLQRLQNLAAMLAAMSGR